MERKFKILEKFFLKKLFNSQIKTLKKRGCPKQITTTLQSQKSSVLKKTSEMTFKSGCIPFLPVVPSTLCSIPRLMTMTRNEHGIGYAILDSTKIFDVVDVPKEPYYIYDVEDGEFTRGKMPDIVKRIFRRQKRSPLTVAEVIALCVHASVFSWQHGMWAIGSRYKSYESDESDDFTPIIITSPTGLPSLEYDKFYIAGYALKCSPSCGSR